MTHRIRALAASTLAWSLPLAAVQPPRYDIPYVGIAASILSPDSVRNSDAAGGGFALAGGYPLGRTSALELRFSDHEMRRTLDKSSNYQTSLFLDYVHDFGTTVQDEGGPLSGTKVFVLGGLGLVQEDSYGERGNYAGLAAGAGALVPLGFRGWAIRFNGRAQVEMNGDLCDSAAVTAGHCESEADYLMDYMLEAGLQIPLSLFFDRPPTISPTEDCPIAVVDPVAGRRDCTVDSDRDGVADETDQCPASAAGSSVDATGCTR